MECPHTSNGVIQPRRFLGLKLISRSTYANSSPLVAALSAPPTTIEFAFPERSAVRLTVRNALGQEVETLVAEEIAAGTHKTTWDPSKYSGHALPSGIYLYRLRTEALTQTKRMILLK